MNMRILFTSAMLFVGAVFSGNAVWAASVNSNTAAIIVQPIGITNSGGMDFGLLAAGVAVSVVNVSTASARSLSSGDVTLITGGSISAASFDVTGEPNGGFGITLPAGSITLTSGGDTMTVDTFVDSDAGTGTLDGTGNASFTVGANLNVSAAQPVGNYTGTFAASVVYQ